MLDTSHHSASAGVNGERSIDAALPIFVSARVPTFYELRMPKRPETVNFRISLEGKDLLVQLQDYYGISQSAVFEMLLRDKARELDLKPRSASKNSRR